MGRQEEGGQGGKEREGGRGLTFRRSELVYKHTNSTETNYVEKVVFLDDFKLINESVVF